MYDQLKLDNQLCFPLYNAARLVVRAYTPLLNELGITYPQYLVLMALWEKDEQTVNDLVDRLLLETNTLTPLLQRMEKAGIIQRTPDSKDKRKVIIRLTEKGKTMEHRAACIPSRLMEKLSVKDADVNFFRFRDDLHKLIEILK